jgi:5-methylcytosine-specific restriction endonuclease McrA
MTGLSPRRPCLRCGALTESGSYCAAHQLDYTRRDPRRGPSRWAYQRLCVEVMRRDGYQCRALVDGKRCPATTGLQVHHLVALVAGGTNAKANLVTTCATCHRRLHAARTDVT